jgi:hypothetical protein
VYKLAESVRKLYPDVKDDYLFELEVSDDPSGISSYDCSDTDHVGRCESTRGLYIESRDMRCACSNYDDDFAKPTAQMVLGHITYD